MRILPIDKVTVQSNLSIAELKEKLLQQLDIDDSFGIFTSKNNKKYYGSIEGNYFEIKRKIKYRSSFRPVIKGVFSESTSKTTINIEMRLEGLVSLFFYIWCLVAVAFIVMLIRSSIQNGAFIPEMFLPLFAIVFMYGVMYISFKYETTLSNDHIKEIFHE